MGFLDSIVHGIKAAGGAASDFVGSAFDFARDASSASQAGVAAAISAAATEATGTPHVYAPGQITSGAINALNVPYKELVDRPLQTPSNLFINNINEKHKSGISAFLPDSWSDVKDAWNDSSDRTLGQSVQELASSGPTGAIIDLATYGAPLTPTGLTLGGGSTAGLALAGHIADVPGLTVDVSTPSARKKLESGKADGLAGLGFKTESMATDLVANFTADPLNLIGVGYAAKVAKARGVIKGANGMRDLARAMNGAPTNTSIAKNLRSMHDFLESSRDTALRKSNLTLSPDKVTTIDSFGNERTANIAEQTANFNPLFIKNAAPDMPMSVATQLATAMKLPDRSLRTRAYNDIIAASAGDTTALDRLGKADQLLGALAKRATSPNEDEVLDSLGQQSRFQASLSGDLEAKPVLGPRRPTDQEVMSEAEKGLINLHMDWVQQLHGNDMQGMIETLRGMDDTAHSVRFVNKPNVDRALWIQQGRDIAPLGRRKSSAEIEVSIPGAAQTAATAYEPGALVMRDPSERLNKIWRAFSTQLPSGIVHLKNSEVDTSIRELRAYMQTAHVRPDIIDRRLNDWVTTPTTADRLDLLEKIENDSFLALGARYNAPLSLVDHAAKQVRTSRGQWRTTSYSGVQSAGKNVDSVAHREADGTITYVPNAILGTQEPAVAAISDIHKVARYMRRDAARLSAGQTFLGKFGEAGVKGAYGAWDMLDEAATGMQRLWKSGVLLRLGYPIRNTIDNDMSTYATQGADVLASVITQRLKSIGRLSNGLVAHRMANDEKRLIVLKMEHGTDGIDHSAEIAKIEDRMANPQKYMHGIPKEQLQGPKLPGGGRAPGWMEGPEGQASRSRVSSSIGQAMSHDIAKTYKEAFSVAGQWKRIDKTDPAYFEQWAGVVNRQILQDPAARKVLFDGMDEHQLAKWLRKDPAGRAYAKRIPSRSSDPEAWAEAMVKHVRGTVTDDVVQLLGKGKDGRVTARQLSGIPDARLPTVNGQTGEMLQAGSKLNNLFEHMNASAMHFVGDLPDDAFTRQPLAAALYNKRFEELLANHTGETVDGEELQRMARASRTYAEKEIRRTVYDTQFHSNAAHSMRLISPFANAWQESLRRYGLAAWNRPHAIYNLWKAYESPAKYGYVVDANGKKVDSFNPLNPGDTYLQIPMLGWGDNGKLGLKEYRLNVSALQPAIQGNPWWSPGVGPLGAITAQELTIHHPSLDEAYSQFISPYGPTANLRDQFEPASVKRAIEVIHGDVNNTFHENVMHIIQDQHAAYLEGTRKTDYNTDEAISQARHLAEFQLIASIGMPGIPTQNSDFQFYRDQWQTIEQQGRDENKPFSWASDQFLKKYGDSFFALTQSTSKNNAGLDPTANAVAGFKKYRGTISGLENADLAGAVVGPDGAGGKFNQAAYRSEYGTQITTAGGNQPSNMARSKQTIGQFTSSMEVQEAWTKYNQFMADAQAYALDKGGKDSSYQDFPLVVQARNILLHELSTNQDGSTSTFGEQWGSFDAPGKYESYVNDFSKIVAAPKLKGRQDVQALGQYVAARRAISQQLLQRQLAGGSANIDALVNEDLKQAFTQYVNLLANSNTTFNENWYQKYIVRDPFYDKTAEVGSVSQ